MDSPAGIRRRTGDRLSEGLFAEDQKDPYDEKLLVTVKEAAWMLSLPESAIRQGVSDGDLHRVFIGTGTTHYRIVYASLLAWVNDWPHEPRWRHW